MTEDRSRRMPNIELRGGQAHTTSSTTPKHTTAAASHDEGGEHMAPHLQLRHCIHQTGV